MTALKDKVTILVVTHNMQQAARVSDYTAYMYLGELMEFGETDQIFIKPKRKETEDYITGRFGWRTSLMNHVGRTKDANR